MFLPRPQLVLLTHMSDGREVHISYVEDSFEQMRWGWAWRRPWEGQREGCCGRAKSIGGSLTGRRDWGPLRCSTLAMEAGDLAMGLSRSRHSLGNGHALQGPRFSMSFSHPVEVGGTCVDTGETSAASWHSLRLQICEGRFTLLIS